MGKWDTSPQWFHLPIVFAMKCVTIGTAGASTSPAAQSTPTIKSRYKRMAAVQKSKQREAVTSAMDNAVNEDGLLFH